VYQLPHSGATKRDTLITLQVGGKWTPVYRHRLSYTSDSHWPKQDFQVAAGGSLVAYPVATFQSIAVGIAEKPMPRPTDVTATAAGSLPVLTGRSTGARQKRSWSGLCTIWKSCGASSVVLRIGPVVASQVQMDWQAAMRAARSQHSRKFRTARWGTTQSDRLLVAPVRRKPKPNWRKQPGTIDDKVVCIRNPWGKREWKGAWSKLIVNRTKSLRDKLGMKHGAKDD
jgi:hypothetical protein